MLLASCGWFDAGPVTEQDSDADDGGLDGTEAVADTPEHDETDTAPPDGSPDPDVIIDIAEDDGGPPEIPADLPADDAPETQPLTCGNGTFEPGEACDDLNTVTELCAMGTSCLGDCSMLEATCGDAAHDQGERCDDGNLDSMDLCTTSCTVNNKNIGAPCTCSGPQCSNYDYTVGDIQGCENVQVPTGSGGVLACLRTPSFLPGSMPYYAEGYCSIIALTCEGSLCGMVPSVGDMTSFECPGGSYEHTGTSDFFGTTLTYKVCLQACSSPSECRWNAMESADGPCGGMDCISLPEDPSVKVCDDPRNF